VSTTEIDALLTQLRDTDDDEAIVAQLRQHSRAVVAERFDALLPEQTAPAMRRALRYSLLLRLGPIKHAIGSKRTVDDLLDEHPDAGFGVALIELVSRSSSGREQLHAHLEEGLKKQERTRAVDVSRDGRCIVVVGPETVSAHTPSGECLGVVPLETGFFATVTLLDDGRAAVVDSTLEIVDFLSGSITRPGLAIRDRISKVYSVERSGEFVASSRDRAWIWDSPTSEPTTVPLPALTFGASLLPSRTRIAARTRTPFATHILDRASGAPISEPLVGVSAQVFLSDDRWLCYADGDLVRLDLRTGERERILRPTPEKQRRVACDETAKTVAVYEEDAGLTIWREGSGLTKVDGIVGPIARAIVDDTIIAANAPGSAVPFVRIPVPR
jgi:hypothetical protein